MSWRPNQDLKSFDKVPSTTTQVSSPPNTENLNEKQASKKRKVNRSKNVRRDTDKVKNFSVTLEDIDTTVIEHLRGLKLSVLSEGKQRDVPIIYADAERWHAVQKDGFMRDHRGQIQLPALLIKRGDSQRNESLRIFNRYNELLSMPFIRKYSPKNAYDKFSLSNNCHQPVHEIHNVNLPDHFIITYEGIAWTDKIDQNNPIVERISYSSEDYWGTDKYFKFRAMIPNFGLNTEMADGENRIVKTNFTIQVYAYLLPEIHKDWKSTTQKSFVPRRVIWGVEIQTGVDNFNLSPLDISTKYLPETVYSFDSDMISFDNSQLSYFDKD